MFRKFRKNVKAISPVISVLLMIAVAVVASLVAYAWVMGYIGFQTSRTGQAIQIQSVAKDGSVYVQNIGGGQVTFSNPCVYINGTSVTVSGTGSFGPGETATLTGAGTWTDGDTITVKVTSADGTFSQVVKTFP